MAAEDGIEVRLRTVWGAKYPLKEEADKEAAYVRGDWDDTSHIGHENDRIIHGLTEDSTFKDLGNLVKDKIHKILNEYSATILPFMRERCIGKTKTKIKDPEDKSDNPRLIEVIHTEETVNKVTTDLISLFRAKLETDFTKNALMFRPYNDGDVLDPEKKHDELGGGTDEMFAFFDDSVNIADISASQEDEETGKEYYTVYLLRMELNDDVEGFLAAAAKHKAEMEGKKAEVKIAANHKGGWEQDLMDAASEAIKVRGM